MLSATIFWCSKLAPLLRGCPLGKGVIHVRHLAHRLPRFQIPNFFCFLAGFFGSLRPMLGGIWTILLRHDYGSMRNGTLSYVRRLIVDWGLTVSLFRQPG